MKMYSSLKRLVEGSEGPGRTFDLGVQCLIVLSLVAFAVETLPDLSAPTRRFLKVFETATVLLFSLEYVLRLLVADRKMGFVFSFFGIVDLAAILPFYLATGLDLRSIRIVRLLRLFRLFKFARYSATIRRLRQAFALVREELTLFLVLIAIVMYVASVGIYYFEREAQPQAFASVFHALWWSLTTLTTVGYGDVYPVTTGGRVFTAVVLLIGLGVVAVPAGMVAAALSEARGLDQGET